MPSARQVAVLLTLGAALSASAAYAADPPSKAPPEAQFASMQERLNKAADAALRNVQQPNPAPSKAATRPSDAPEASNSEVSRLSPAAQARVERLRPLVEPILQSEGVPPEMIAVLRVESAGNPLALSSKGARGLWQFMPNTARRYGLRVDAERDDRLDVELSTRAAAHYLHDLHRRFGDWPLALAAYNAGALQVERAVRLGGAADFWQLSGKGLLPHETSAYVPAVFGVMAPASPETVLGRPRLGKARTPVVVYAAPGMPLATGR